MSGATQRRTVKEMMFSVWPSYLASKYIKNSYTSCKP